MVTPMTSRGRPTTRTANRPSLEPAAAEGGERRKGALHGNTVSVLREMIVTGVLAPGERLNERELCERLQVSRTPVREAIKTLSQEGLLRASPNRSPVVAPLDPHETAALVDVVAAIEALAGELAAARITDAEVAELGILHYTMLRHHARAELPHYFEANRGFHRRIVEYSCNPVLLWTWDQLALRVDRARFASNRSPARWKQAMAEHGEILAALMRRDRRAAADSMRAHVKQGLAVVLDALRRGSDTDTPPVAARGRSARAPASST
jgi:DNA-binding GntR family transcriptional regulator